MVKNVLPALAILVLLSSCSTFKSLNFTSNRQVSNLAAPGVPSQSKFIDEISVTAPATLEKAEVRSEPKIAIAERSVNMTPAPVVVKQENDDIATILASGTRSMGAFSIESSSAVQHKYAVLMNTEIESLPSKSLLHAVDEWYGVRYRTGGNTKGGVDCSGFTCAVYTSVYGYSLPRVSRDQYRISRKLSIAELQEGDLVFFNTNGRGVSHVGVYLGNNKFIHASVSRGVMVNDLSEKYYSVRYYGAGRIEEKQELTNE
jgi:cell wall-associated NlpC family hydrolase